jgi:hypothetical protein
MNMLDNTGTNKIFNIKENLIAAIGFIFAAIVFTYPLILDFQTKLPGVLADPYQFVWGFWHFKKSVLQLQNPFVTDFMYYPMQINLILHTWVPAKTAIAFLLSFLSGNWILIYNILFMFSFVMAALGMYFLVLQYVPSRMLAFISGIIFAFAPNQMAHAHGHFNMISMEAMPWIVLLGHYYMKQFRWSTLAGLVVLLGYQFFCDYQFIVYLIILYGVWVIYTAKLDWGKYKELLLKTMPVAGCFVLVLAPFWIMAIKAIKVYSVMSIHSGGWGKAEDYSMDILHLLLPSNLHFIWGDFIVKVLAVMKVPFPSAEMNGFIGYSVIALCVFAGIKYWSKNSVRFWCIAGVSFMLLSFGPLLNFKGISLNATPWINLFSFDGIKVLFPMPYTIIHYLPVFNGARIPARFIIITIMSAAILVSIAGYYIIDNIKVSEIGKRALKIILLLIIILEYLPIPFPTYEPRVPEIYNSIRQDVNENNVVLDLPSPPWDWNALDTLYYQVYHQHKMIGGWTARSSGPQVDYFFKYHIIKEVSRGNADIDVGEFADMLKNLDVYYIVVRDSKTMNVIHKMADSLPEMEMMQGIDGYELWKVQKGHLE